MTYGDSFANRLVAVRKARGLTQERLAELAGLHRNQISNLERNLNSRGESPSDPALQTVYRIAAALEIEPVLLMPDAGRRPARRSTEQETTAELSRVTATLTAVINRRASDG